MAERVAWERMSSCLRVSYIRGASHKSQISGLSTTCLTVRFSLTPCAEDLDKGGTGSATASHAHKTYSSLSEELRTPGFQNVQLPAGICLKEQV